MRLLLTLRSSVSVLELVLVGQYLMVVETSAGVEALIDSMKVCRDVDIRVCSDLAAEKSRTITCLRLKELIETFKVRISVFNWRRHRLISRRLCH